MKLTKKIRFETILLLSQTCATRERYKYMKVKRASDEILEEKLIYKYKQYFLGNIYCFKTASQLITQLYSRLSNINI